MVTEFLAAYTVASSAQCPSMRPESSAMCCRAYRLGRGRQSYNMLAIRIFDSNDHTRWLEPTYASKVATRQSLALDVCIGGAGNL